MKLRVSLFVALCYAIMPINAYAQADGFGFLPTDKLIQEDLYSFEPYPLSELQDRIQYALEENEPEAQYRLGRMYEEGIGVNIDYQIARQWYEASAANGFVPAMVSLANMFLYGAEGVDPDPTLALSYLREAEKSENPLVFYELGLYFENVGGTAQNYAKAFEYYQKAAREGVLNAHVKLAIFYQYGLGVEPDITLAIRHYRLLEELAEDDNVSQYVSAMLGSIYLEYGIVETDMEKRFRWLRAAAQEGNVEAMFFLGDAYYTGRGIERDYAKSAGWYLAAARQDHAQAMTNLAYLYLNGYGVKKDYEKAFNWFKSAAELGNAEGAWNVGNIYYYGYGKDQDLAQAREWFSRSAKLQRRQR